MTEDDEVKEPKYPTLRVDGEGSDDACVVANAIYALANEVARLGDAAEEPAEGLYRLLRAAREGRSDGS